MILVSTFFGGYGVPLGRPGFSRRPPCCSSHGNWPSSAHGSERFKTPHHRDFYTKCHMREVALFLNHVLGPFLNHPIAPIMCMKNSYQNLAALYFSNLYLYYNCTSQGGILSSRQKKYELLENRKIPLTQDRISMKIWNNLLEPHIPDIYTFSIHL